MNTDGDDTGVETSDRCDTFLFYFFLHFFPSSSKNVHIGATNLLYYESECVSRSNNGFQWFYEICTGCKRDF